MSIANASVRFATFVIATFVLAASAFGDVVIYVDDDASDGGDGLSWDSAFNDLQDALDLAAELEGEACEIWVAAGIYKPSREVIDGMPRTATFELVDGVGMYGGFLGFEETRERAIPGEVNSILCGDLAGDDDSQPGATLGDVPNDLYNDPRRAENAYRVLSGDGTRQGTIIDGFTIRRGAAQDEDTGIFVNGGGLFIHQGDIMVSRCIFEDCTARIDGAAAWINGSGFFADCLFRYNFAVEIAGGVCSSGNLNLDQCRFENNDTDGLGGALWAAGFTQIFHSSFVRNHASTAGGAIVVPIGDFLLRHCQFHENGADNGGALWLGGFSASIFNCLFNGNGALAGGAIAHTGDGQLRCLNTTFTSNQAENGGGVWSNGIGPAPEFINGVFYNNWSANAGTDFEGHIRSDQPPVVEFTCIEDLPETFPGPGNVVGNPILEDIAGFDDVIGTEDDNLRLNFESPCIDAGNNEPAMAAFLEEDLDHFSRFEDVGFINDTGLGQSPIIDMGAYEAFETSSTDATQRPSEEPSAQSTGLAGDGTMDPEQTLPPEVLLLLGSAPCGAVGMLSLMMSFVGCTALKRRRRQLP